MLSKFFCDELINHFEMCSENQVGSSGGLYGFNRRRKNSVDISSSLFDDHSPIIETFRIKLFQGIQEMLQVETFKHLETIPSWSVFNEFNIQKYNPGQGYYETHCEHGPTAKKSTGKYSVGMYSNRILSWMVYLNDVKDKGGTHFPIQNITLKARVGDLYIWPAGWTHMHHGVPSPSQIKYIITGWVNYKDMDSL